MRSSENWIAFVLSTPITSLAEKLCTRDKDKNPVIFIAVRYNYSDGEKCSGVTCGYHVTKRTFLIGIFEACVCFDPMLETSWILQFTLESINKKLDEFHCPEHNIGDRIATVDREDISFCLVQIQRWRLKFSGYFKK